MSRRVNEALLGETLFPMWMQLGRFPCQSGAGEALHSSARDIICALAKNLVQPINHARQFFLGSAGKPLADAIDRQRADLTDLDP